MPNGKLGSVLRHIRQLIHRPEAAAITDRQLLERFAAQRDESAFATLVQRHGPLVLGVCRRILQNDHDAEDALQATFLVLARKATAICWQESVSSWLYEVASRIAAKAKVRTIRQQVHQRQAEAMPSFDPVSTAARHELHAVLDEEVRRLPERYRLPVVLCFLEGLSRSEAAQQLGWKEGTVGGRLARARDLLQKRLARRGVALSVGALPAVLAENLATAAVPAPLTAMTVKAAVEFAVGDLATSAASAQAATLAHEMLNALGVVRVKRIAAVVLALGLFGTGTTLLVHQTWMNPASSNSVADRPGNEKTVKPLVRPESGQDKRPGIPGSPAPGAALPGASAK